jgi:hypothetical protein
MPKLREWFFGSKPKIKQQPTGTPEQTQFGGTDLINMLKQMMGQGGGLNQANQYDQSLLNQQPQSYEEFSSPYLQQFNQQIAPQLAERYAGAGALSSSGFGQALGGAAGDLQAQLAQLFSQLQQNHQQLQGQAAGRQQNQFANLSQLGLGYSPFGYNEKPGSSGLFAPLLSAFGKATGGPLGGAAASGISKLFS